MKKLGRSAIASLGVAVVLSGCSGDDGPVALAPHGVDQLDASADGSDGSGEAGHAAAGAAGQGGQGGSGGSGGLAGAGGTAGQAGAGGSGGSAGSGGTCGALDQPCCSGTCHQANTTCYADTCVACGGEAQRCCEGACSDGFTCLAGTCSPCGAPGQICCDTSCNDPGFACSGGQCQHCGLDNEPCCEGDQCASTTLACSNGVCTQCGGEGQPCCGSACDQYLLCTNGTCECGAEGQYCCGGTTCDDPDLTCAGTCVCESVCSPDAKSVLDCHGNVIQACAGTEECVNGVCLDPCLEAAATKSSYGCEFWALKTDVITPTLSGACFAAFVTNTRSTPVHIQVEYDGQTLPVADFARIPQGQGPSLTYVPYDATAGLPPGEAAILFLSRGDGPLPDCPVPAALGDVAVYGTGRGKAFRIVTDKPVGAYQILPYGGEAIGAAAASLLLPTNAWDTSYLAVNAYQKSQVVSDDMPSLNILAKEDGTQVTVHPRVAIVGGTGVASSPAGQPVTYTLNRGEHVQISQVQELTGSMVQSNKPVALWGAATCMSVPAWEFYCDSAQQQLPPLRALGNVYVGVRHRDRGPGQTEAPPWRLVGAVDSTNLVWQPSVPSGAPTTLQAGQVVEFASSEPFVVESQDTDHPFYMAAYMTGGVSFGRGDPEWVNVVPVDQYLDKYVFFTDPKYSETNLVVVRRPDVNGQWADVHLDCRGNLTDWTQVGDFQYTRVDLVTGNFQNVGSCSNGRHEMSSAGPFGVTVWGWLTEAANPASALVSYAYPAGASVRQINNVK